MSETWIIAVGEKDFLTVEAAACVVRDGHLLAFDNTYGQDLTPPIAAWAPGQWRSFWARPKPRPLEAARARIATLERWIAENPEADLRRLYEWQLAADRLHLADLEKLAVAPDCDRESDNGRQA